ncbi:IucA/IucC family protein [Paenibacillus xerothermodurans]|uniref:Adhesin n=1 Tax=Paenibacillus xerothermodurans TaxID=1977292 RepID=A0A2W1NVZ5_PAEXE|nr:IucA/IucC family protein [Paenibacillus xerothermodurans]PZE19862.1 adhesin [Paenibacillus xerothermodurans]
MSVSVCNQPYHARVSRLLETTLEDEEAKLGSFLAQHRPELFDHYLSMIPEGRAGILNRLVSSIWRENISGLAKKSSTLVRDASGWAMCVDSVATETDCLEELLNAVYPLLPRDADRIEILPLPKQQLYMVLPVQRISGFGRLIVKGPYFILSHSEPPRRIYHALQVLALLYDEGWEADADAFRMFADDVCNSTANLTLAYAYRQHHQQGFGDVSTSSAAVSDYTRMERYVVEGHPCHPGAKMRKGLSPEETLAYSSEFGSEIAVHLLAVHNSLYSLATLEDGVDWNALITREVPKLLEHATEHLSSLGLSVGAYALLPVHPWQLKHIVPQLYDSEIKSQDVVLIPGFHLDYYASMSFRTLVPADRDQPHLKLTAQVHLTGEVRTLSEQTIHNGPLMTRILQRLIQQDPLIPHDRFQAVAELGGLHFLHPMDEEPVQTERSENLACVLRENLYRYVGDDEIPVVGSALVAISYGSGLPVFAELIARYQQSRSFRSAEEAIFSFYDAYVSQALWGLLPLLVKYGIGLEAHLQNTVPVFKTDGTPSKMLVRDWEGIRVHRDRLISAGLDVSMFHPKSRIIVNDLKSVRNKLFYSIFQNHLGELALRLSTYYGIEETRLWNLVHTIAASIFDRIEQHPAYREQSKSDRSVFFQEQVDYKAITLMRMTGEAHQYTYAKVPNPLHQES